MCMKPRITSTLSLLLGIASVTLSYWMLGFFALVSLIFGHTDFTRHTGQSWRGFVFLITGPKRVGYVLGWLGFAVVLGCLGFWLAGPERRAGAGPGWRPRRSGSVSGVSLGPSSMRSSWPRYSPTGGSHEAEGRPRRAVVVGFDPCVPF